MTTLPIHYESFLVGNITLAEDGPSFAYDPRWPKTRGAFPVSLGMPLDPSPFASGTLLPWLANLLPGHGRSVDHRAAAGGRGSRLSADLRRGWS